MEVKLIVTSGKNRGKEIVLPGPQFLIGRGEGCHLRPASERISRKHCAIVVSEGRVTARDLKSTNGTAVNGERIADEKELKNGDIINVGGVIEFEIQFTVAVGGKKGPKVNSIQEAAARTVQKAVSDDLDITQWLDDESPKKPTAPSDIDLKTSSTIHQNLADTTTILLPEKQDEKAKDKKEKDKVPPPKVIGQFDRAKKPTSANSGDAADNMLRQFFGRKK